MAALRMAKTKWEPGTGADSACSVMEWPPERPHIRRDVTQDRVALACASRIHHPTGHTSAEAWRTSTRDILRQRRLARRQGT